MTLSFDDNWVMSENVEDIGTEILDEDFAEVNQYQIEEDEDAILVHNWEDEHYGGRDELEDEEDNKMEEWWSLE